MNALLANLAAALPLIARRDLPRIAASFARAGYADQAKACRQELARRA